MRAFVFTDKALERYAGQFVWLAVDTENSTNVEFLKKYPISVWPTLLVIDPKTNQIVWQYGINNRPGRTAGLLFIPDGIDLKPPNWGNPT